MRLTYTISMLIIAFTVCVNVSANTHKQIVGATEVIRIEEGNLSFKARVDTGATTSSINVKGIELDSTGDPVNKPVSFYIVNTDGQSAKIKTYVASVDLIKTSEGSEHRYKVPLTLVWNNTRKTILVTLNDRSGMKYRLLLGRNWLRGDFLVDVDKNNED